MEEVQQLKESLLHFLLSALVPAVPEPELEPELEPEPEPELDPELQDGEDSEFVPVHLLPPTISAHEYIQFPFDERLGCELESVGLRNTGVCEGDAWVFTSEV
jgi:hypothetical protein